MTPPQIDSIPIDSIDLQTRVRYAETDSAKEELEKLKDSINRYGLLQPILVDQNNVLLDGWRRFTACRLLGWTTIPAYRRERLTEAEYFELERETNFQRLGFTWTEEIALACRIHRAHAQRAAITGSPWTQAMTGDLLGGYSKSYVSNCLILEPYITKQDRDVIDCDGITDALRVLYRRKEDEALAILAQRTRLVPAQTPNISATSGKVEVPTAAEVKSVDSVLADLLGPNAVNVLPKTTIDLSHTLFRGDMIDILSQWPDACVDHIITDPPYAIDMDNLDQSSTSMMDTTRVDATHDVDQNLGDIPKWLNLCYKVLKPGGFCIWWCDISNWQFIIDQAAINGFKVQRWPFVWCKSHQCKNQMAHVNFTKNIEIAMVMRKGVANLPTPMQTSYLLASKEPHISNPFAKPFAVWRALVEAVSYPGQVVLEPFAGEGSGVLSMMRLNRKVLAVEKEEHQFNVLLNEVKGYWSGALKNVEFI